MATYQNPVDGLAAAQSDATRALTATLLTGAAGIPIVGTGSEQSISHGLSGTPTKVIPFALAGTPTFTLGTHTSSVVKVTATVASVFHIFVAL